VFLDIEVVDTRSLVPILVDVPGRVVVVLWSILTAVAVLVYGFSRIFKLDALSLKTAQMMMLRSFSPTEIAYLNLY
jgi:hypothetical protein